MPCYILRLFEYIPLSISFSSPQPSTGNLQRPTSKHHSVTLANQMSILQEGNDATFEV